MSTKVWQCKSCDLYNCNTRIQCQACFTSSPIKSGVPPFNLTQQLPSSQLLNLIIKSSNIAKQSGYLISFESEQSIIKDNGIDFVSTLAINLAKKPKMKIDKNNVKGFENPFIAPFDVGAHVCDLNDKYRLLLNKFNVVPNHVLIVSTSFIKQTLPLNPQDFEITLKVIVSMDGLCYFNSGPFSGASQPHKHLQIIPRNYQYPIEQFIKNIDQKQQSDNDMDIQLYELKEYSFIHRIYLIDNEDKIDAGNVLYKAYCSMLNEIKKDMESSDNTEYLNDDKFSYNLIMTADYMFMVTRKSDIYYNAEEFGNDVNISINAVTFAGTFFCKSKESLSMLKQVGPLSVLKYVTLQHKK